MIHRPYRRPPGARRIRTLILVSLGAAVCLVAPLPLLAQGVSLEAGATTAGPGGDSGNRYRGPSGVLSIGYQPGGALEFRFSYDRFRIAGEDPAGSGYEVAANVPTFGIALRSTYLGLNPYIQAGAGISAFERVGEGREAPGTSFAMNGGVGVELVRGGRATLVLEARTLLLFTDELVTRSPVVMWPLMMGFRIHF